MRKIIIGFLAGLVSGMFASGGGMILVPTFVYLLGISEKKARANSLICILPMVITSGFFYHQGDYIDWKIGILAAIGGIAGGFLGAKLLKKISDIYLKIAFIIFLVYVAIKLIMS